MGTQSELAFDVTELSEGFDGEVLLPSHGGFDEARKIFNSMIDRQPGVIAQCGTAQDVARAINFGRDHSLEISVRGGGHGVAGKSLTDGGLMIDLRRMNSTEVNPEAQTILVGGGATMSNLDRATEKHSLVVTGGRVSTTGVGGFTLGGGSGWLERKYGLACDSLLAVDLVTANGRIIRATEDENPELFWALHGGGGNFGVATAFTFKLRPIKDFSMALLLWTPDAGPKVLRRWRDLIETSPDELGGGALYLTGPPEEFVPEHLVGQLTFGVLVTYLGPQAELTDLVKPILEHNPDGQLIMDMPYADLQCMIDDPPGLRNYWSAEYLDLLPDEAIDLFCARGFDMVVPSPSQHVLFPQGGAMSRSDGGMPISFRKAQWVVHPLGIWEDPADDEKAFQWARRTRADMKPWSSGAVYLNFIGEEGQDRVIAGYGQDNYDRLVTVKNEYDPENLFRLNHNILPN